MLIRSIEKFLKTHNMPPTKFGRLATHDPRFVLDLRNGRSPREDMVVKVQNFMRSYHGEADPSQPESQPNEETCRHA